MSTHIGELCARNCKSYHTYQVAAYAGFRSVGALQTSTSLSGSGPSLTVKRIVVHIEMKNNTFLGIKHKKTFIHRKNGNGRNTDNIYMA